MKNLLILCCIAFIMVSCSKDDGENAIEEQNTVGNVEVEQSKALRFTFEKMKENQNLAGRGAAIAVNDLCFQFDYPILLEYNDNSQVTVQDYEQLLQLLLDETVSLHIVGIGFPFDIINYSTNTQATISSGTDFDNLVTNCGYDIIDVNDIVDLTDNCFTVNYPISVLVNGSLETFTSQQNAQNYFVNFTGTIQSIDFVYPFSVQLISNNSTVTINNDYEVIYLVNTTCAIN